MIIALAHYSDQPKDNPYVWSLGTALARQGHDVRSLPASALFLRYRSARIASTIHIQWFETQVGADSLVKMLVKSVVFLLQLKLCSLVGKHLVWTVHNARSHEARFPRLEHWVVRSLASTVDDIIVHCDGIRPAIEAHLGAGSGDKITTIAHGSYIGLYRDEISRDAARKALGLDEDDVVVLFLGAIRPYKGVEDLVDAFRRLDKPGTKLLVAGKPKGRDIADRIDKLCSGNPDILFRPEFIADDDMQIYLRAADVVAFPYRDILMSGAVILAMSFGRPCIAPRLGCLPAVLDADSNYLYSPAGGDGLQDALEAAVQDRSTLSEKGQRNFERAKTLDWDEIARETARLYR